MRFVECPSCKSSLTITGIEDDPRLVKKIEWRCNNNECGKTGGIIVDDIRRHYPKPTSNLPQPKPSG